MFQTVTPSIIMSFSLYTQQWYMSYKFWWQLACKLSANLYVLMCLQWKTPGDGWRNCPKHVEFYSKNKSEKLVHLVTFIIRIRILLYPPQFNCTYHSQRSFISETQRYNGHGQKGLLLYTIYRHENKISCSYILHTFKHSIILTFPKLTKHTDY